MNLHNACLHEASIRYKAAVKNIQYDIWQAQQEFKAKTSRIHDAFFNGLDKAAIIYAAEKLDLQERVDKNWLSRQTMEPGSAEWLEAAELEKSLHREAVRQKAAAAERRLALRAQQASDTEEAKTSFRAFMEEAEEKKAKAKEELEALVLRISSADTDTLRDILFELTGIRPDDCGADDACDSQSSGSNVSKK